ncbi:MAG: DUF4339 domain-containing protein, partial [Desulfobacterales bacterium]
MNLYYADGEQQKGPIGKNELQALITAKRINTKTLVWQPGMENWQELGVFVRSRYAKAAPSHESSVPAKQSVCAECAKSFSQDEMIRFQESWVCADCKPIFIQKIKEGVSVCG